MSISNSFTESPASSCREHSLIAAIIERSIRDCGLADRKEKIQSLEWINFVPEGDELPEWTFLWCCREIGLSPKNVAKLKNFANLQRRPLV